MCPSLLLFNHLINDYFLGGGNLIAKTWEVGDIRAWMWFSKYFLRLSGGGGVNSHFGFFFMFVDDDAFLFV